MPRKAQTKGPCVDREHVQIPWPTKTRVYPVSQARWSPLHLPLQMQPLQFPLAL